MNYSESSRIGTTEKMSDLFQLLTPLSVDKPFKTAVNTIGIMDSYALVVVTLLAYGSYTWWSRHPLDGQNRDSKVSPPIITFLGNFHRLSDYLGQLYLTTFVFPQKIGNPNKLQLPTEVTDELAMDVTRKRTQELAKGDKEAFRGEEELGKGDQEAFRGKEELAKVDQEAFPGKEELAKGDQKAFRGKKEWINSCQVGGYSSCSIM